MEYLGILFFIGIFVFAIAMTIIDSDRNKERIRAEIQRQGGRVIHISYRFFGNKGTYTFDVAFSDPAGKKHKTVCIVTGIGDAPLFWTKSPGEIIGNQQSGIRFPGPTAQMYVEPDLLSSKEQIIDDLHRENLRLKEKLARMQSSG